MKYLFIDFDGVLHGEIFNQDYFSHSVNLCEQLYPYKHLFKIIISSSWRDTYEYDICIEAFETNIRDNVIGITPSHGDNGFLEQGRYKEILAYCEKFNISNKNWLAIDDMPNLFPKNYKNLILTNPLTGINNENIQEIILWLNKKS